MFRDATIHHETVENWCDVCDEVGCDVRKCKQVLVCSC